MVQLKQNPNFSNKSGDSESKDPIDSTKVPIEDQLNLEEKENLKPPPESDIPPPSDRPPTAESLKVKTDKFAPDWVYANLEEVT